MNTDKTIETLATPDAGPVGGCAHNWHDYGQHNGKNLAWCPRCEMLSETGKEGVPYGSPKAAATPAPVAVESEWKCDGCGNVQPAIGRADCSKCGGFLGMLLPTPQAAEQVSDARYRFIARKFLHMKTSQAELFLSTLGLDEADACAELDSLIDAALRPSDLVRKVR